MDDCIADHLLGGLCEVNIFFEHLMGIYQCAAFLRGCQRLGYCSRETTGLTELFDEADESLFGSILANNNHVLQSYLPERSLSRYNLRQRTHTKELLNKTTELNCS